MGLWQSAPQKPVIQKDAEDILFKEIERLQKTIKYKSLLIEKENALAIECVNHGNKPSAFAHLRNRKRLQDSVDSMTKMLVNLELQLSAIETAKSNASVVNAIQSANNALKELNIPIERVETVMDEMEVQIDNVNEVSSAINRPIGPQVDVEDELRQLENFMTSSEPVYSLPNAPTNVPVSTETELRQLAEAS